MLRDRALKVPTVETERIVSCSGSRRHARTEARRRAGPWVSLMLAGLCVACDRSHDVASGPSPPSPPTPSPAATEPFTVSGVVYEHTAGERRPLAGLRLLVRTRLSILEVTSGVGGRYEISGVPAGLVTVAPSLETEYRAPCPLGTDVLRSNLPVDVHAVSTTVLSTTGAPASVPMPSLSVSGVVLEHTATGVRPISGASAVLGVDDSDAWVMSATMTDARGRYVLCTSPPGVGTDQLSWVRVRKDSYQAASRSVLMGYAFTADFELIRN